jgi:serine/threonine protein kinase
MPEPSAPPGPPKPESILAGLNPDELFARGMQSVKITGAGGLTNWEPPTIEEAARLFPNYEVLEITGRGGMGAVYKARQLALDRLVAIKLLPLEVSVDRDFAERFKREARTMARLSHPNIVSVFDFGTTTEGHLYFVMEFVEGTTLHHLIRTTGLKAAQALEIIVGVCEALNYAHAEGIVHRDVKPANVLVDVRGRVKVTDFGLARLSGPSAAEQAGYTMTGTVLGTPDYMAPEQKRGMHVDHRADIYSLGVMLYEMLCGHVPQGVFDLPSQLVSVDERVDQVVVRAMQQEPDRRYQNTADMKHEVQTIRVAKDPNARAPRPRNASGTPRSRVLPIAAGVLVAIIALGAFLKFRKSDNEAQPRTSKAGATRPSGITSVAPTEASQSAKPSTVSTTADPGKPTAVASGPAATPTPAPETSTGPTAATPQPAPTASVASTAKPPMAVTTTGAPPGAAVPPVHVPIAVTPDPRPQANPEMASAVSQLGPNPDPTSSTGSSPAVVLAEWQRYAEQAELLVKRRDPDAAIQLYEQAITSAEESATPVPPVEIGRLCIKMGSLEAALGSTAEARGSFEHGKRLLIQAKSSGKLAPDAAQALAELESNLRRLPRDE